jgi:hypothetical protein
MLVTAPLTTHNAWFIRESDLQFHLTTLNWFCDLTYPITFQKREVRVGGCIPDLICVGVAVDPPHEIRGHNWSYRHSHIVWILRKEGPLKDVAIANRCYTHLSKQFLKALTDLLKNGVIYKLDNETFDLSPVVKSLETEVVAIEAKLKHWREAFQQALGYQAFADRVIVAMSAESTPDDPEILSEFVDAGIGLCAVTTQAVEWRTYPRKGIPHASQREYIVTSAISRSDQQLWSRR